MTTRWNPEDPQTPREREPFPGTEELDPAQIFSGPGYQAPPVRTDAVATLALILALLSWIPAVGIAAAATGAWALRRLQGTYSAGMTQAWLGVVLGCASTVAWLWLWWFLFGP